MSDTEDSKTSHGKSIGDLANAGQLIKSEVAKRTYDEALSPAMRELGGFTQDTLKTLRLFTAPLQLAAVFQDRFKAFCERVRENVPEEHQQDAAPEIAKPVMEAFASTSDDSPLMSMFEELMAKAIDKREAGKLSPEFPSLIKGLSPFKALMLKHLRHAQQYTDDLRDRKKNLIVARVGANLDFGKYGGHDHHLTLSKNLKHKNLVTIIDHEKLDNATLYPQLVVPEGLQLIRTTIRLTIFGKLFVSSCVR